MDGIEFVEPTTIYNITVRVRGRSGRHYEVVATRPMGLFLDPAWETAVSGAAWKRDFNSESGRSYAAKLCLNIHEDKQHLPIGDRLASLVLSLHNDIKLAMDIPLVAQFIVCPRDELFNIYIFQEEMIVTMDLLNDEFHDVDAPVTLEGDSDEFEYVDFFHHFWTSEDSQELNLESSENNWAQNLEDDMMQRYERMFD